MKFIEDVKLKTGVWLRERKEKAEAKRALHAAASSEHGHGRFFLLHVPATATIFAAIVEIYWAFLFCIEATGHLLLDFSTAVGSDAPASGAWHFAFTVNSLAVLIGLACATVPIVMISMVWLPVQFTMRGTGRWRRGTMIFCGLLANILVIVSGTVVMNGNRQEQVREGAVVEQTAAQGRAAIDARLAFEQEQLRLALNNSNPYLNQAANVGAEEWERSYVAQARATNDPRLPQLERALGAARAADQRRANIERLTIERATAAPEAATATVVEDDAGRALNDFSTAVQVWRPPFVAFICTLVGIFGSWWVLALMQGLNPKDVMRSGWADEAHRIEDLREQEPIVPQPMKPAREVVTDAETGEELVKVKPKEYWRRKKGKAQKYEVQPEPLPDETGVEYDGGQRTASVTIGGLMANDLTHHQEDNPKAGNHDRHQEEKRADSGASGIGEDGTPDHAADRKADISESEQGGEDVVTDLQTEPSEDDVFILPDLSENAEQEAEASGVEQHVQENDAEPDHREPETDPTRLIAAE